MNGKAKAQEWIDRIVAARGRLNAGVSAAPVAKAAEEGGCGVVGFAASVPVGGRHIFEPSIQMHNRGNGKGGGIAAACLDPAQLKIDATTLANDYIYQVALLDPEIESELESQALAPSLELHHKIKIEPTCDYRDLDLPVKPPEVARYFARVRPEVLARFADEHGLSGMAEREVEDEFIYQNSVRLNRTYYSSLGEKKAFVLSHARNLLIFKIVGYAEQVVKYYGLDDFKAKIWIAHQRYPTKGRVWHPAGSHPFIGLNEALVHNGDFANYYAVAEYLRQQNLAPQFLTDTEVAVQLFDLWSRLYRYPLEAVIEALAPTTEHDFDELSPERQRLYGAIQALHLHCSPDGPWFFIIAQSQPDQDAYRLIGVTDTSMLRPQVFALQEGDVSIGLVASEKQAIDATLRSLNQDDPRFRRVADRYWNARGGSHTDGGAFTFTVRANGHGELLVADKFGKQLSAPAGEYSIMTGRAPEPPADAEENELRIRDGLLESEPEEVFGQVINALHCWRLDHFRWLVELVVASARQDDRSRENALALLTLLNDRRYDPGSMRRSAMLELVRLGIDRLLEAMPGIEAGRGGRFRRIEWSTRASLRPPVEGEDVLAIQARDFPPEGDDCDARLLMAAYREGWKRFIVYGLKGQRFQGCGLGPETVGVRIDLYGASGDYVGSGADGLELHVHDNAQDQLGQVLKRGTVVIHGDVGQAFMYGAKGGEVYILGNAAGRPLINAVGRPRVVINGTALDFLAESFMAGDPHRGGGFVIVNGVAFDDRGRVVSLPTPYPGSNLFSLASGGAIFIRDPGHTLGDQQLNGGEFVGITDQDWRLILPYLQTNQRRFGIEIERDLLAVDGRLRAPGEVYRKVQAKKLAVLAKQTAPE